MGRGRSLEKVELMKKLINKYKWENLSVSGSRGELQIFTVKFSEWVKVPPAAGDVL